MGPDPSSLAPVARDEDHLLDLLGLGGCSGGNLGRDLLLLQWHLLCSNEAVLHADGDVSRLGEREAFSFTGVGGVKVSVQGENSLLHHHHQDQVHIVWNGHEFGKSWSAQDGVVRRIKVCR
jgi:hypothetical protein